jgi:inositol-phosphate phosphatase / L-galactose 1-phosphate phosphatase / histidinol-phosphatase
MTNATELSETLLRGDVPGDCMALAVELADAAALIASRYYRSRLGVESKADESPVTIADKEAEAVMRAMINKRFPGHGILGEEHGNEALNARYVWVLDPIDGTISFASGYPTFGTLVALLEDGVPIIGIIDASALDDRWVGARGRPTTLNGVPTNTRTCAMLDGAWSASSSPLMFDEGEQRDAYTRLARNFGRRQIFSGNCVAAGLLASGHIDVMVESNNGVYDFMALVPVVEGAGGRITDWHGNALSMESDGTVLATGDPTLHDEALAILAG